MDIPYISVTKHVYEEEDNLGETETNKSDEDNASDDEYGNKSEENDENCADYPADEGKHDDLDNDTDEITTTTPSILKIYIFWWEEIIV